MIETSQRGHFMLDVSDKARNAGASTKAPADFQSHLAALEAQGLVVRVDRPICKDTEIHPLVRWQFQGGLPEDQRRAFVFTNVVDSKGRKYDMPVVVGAFGASARIYSIGMGGAGGEKQGGLDQRHRPSDPAGARFFAALPGSRDHWR